MMNFKEIGNANHIFALSQQWEHTRKWNLRLSLLSVDFEKAFDSVKLNVAFRALVDEGFDENYVEIIKEGIRALI